MQLPPRNVVSFACLYRSGGQGEKHTFLCPTKNPSPKVSVVNVILLPLGTAYCQLGSTNTAPPSIIISNLPTHSSQAPLHITPVFPPNAGKHNSNIPLTVKHIPLNSMHLLARLITNIKLSIDNDLHLMKVRGQPCAISLGRVLTLSGPYGCFP